MRTLADQFTASLFDAYRRAKDEAKYHATAFLGMLNEHGGVDTAKRLINAEKASDGYTALYLRQRLDLTVEAIIFDNPRWHELFTEEELQRIAKRLKQYRYPKVLLQGETDVGE